MITLISDRERELMAEVEALTVGRDADKKLIRELDAELGDAKIAIHAAQSCTTHYCDLLKTCEIERDALKADAARYRWLRDSEWEMFDDAGLSGLGIFGEGPDELDAALDAAMAVQS